jgi:hypothetical protein
MRATRLVLVKQRHGTGWYGLNKKRLSLSRSVVDRGLGTAGSTGDTRLTDPSQYLSSSQHSLMRTTKAMTELQRKMEGGVLSNKIGVDRVDAMRDFDAPVTGAERMVADRFDAKEIGFAGEEGNPAAASPPTNSAEHLKWKRDLRVHGASEPISQRVIRGMRQQHTERQRQLQIHTPIVPNQEKYRRLAGQVQNEVVDDQRAELLRDRMATQHGIFSKQRMNAFMLDDDTVFPLWVRNLTPRIRDRVMFGGLGLTEEDEAHRQNLLQLPRQEREAEWERLRAAKSYELGEERLLSPAEVRAERIGTRKFHALRIKRQQREANVRALALREPQKWEAAPIGRVDYSHRLAVVAKHVEANVKTHGKWPLAEDALENAKRRQERNAAKENFLKAPGADFSVVMNRVSPALKEAIKTMNREERPIKRISRKNYVFRLQAVRNGHQDEHGRKFQQISRESRQRFSNAMTTEEFEWERKLAAEVTPNSAGRRAPFSAKLPRAYQRETLAFEAGRQTIFNHSSGSSP